VDKYSDLLRVAISNPGNDHRLGANEAPPAIISIFLGDQLNDIIEQIEKGEATSSKNGTFMEIGVSTLPDLPKDTTDRNRTSPFAFTGNKFEFRAVPSSLSLGDPNCFLNTMVAEALDDIATELEVEVKKGTDFLKAVQKILTDIIKKHKRIIFNGDNYSEDWRKEAEKRGLYNFKTLVDAMPSLITEKNFKLFEKYKVLSKRELEARYVIQLEGYNKTINQEGQVTLDIGRRQILPAALRYQTDLATSISLVKSVASDADLKPQIDLLKQVTSEISSLKTKLDVLEHELGHEGGDELSHAKHYRDNVIPKMKDVRVIADNLETIVDNEYWPLPTYAEMLYIV